MERCSLLQRSSEKEMSKKETIKEYRERLLDTPMDELKTRAEFNTAVQFALDEAVDKGMLRKTWDDKIGEYKYIDARVKDNEV